MVTFQIERIESVMKSEELALAELLDLSEGRFDLHGRRLVLHSSDAMAQLRKDLVETVGQEQARGLLTRFGNFWGRADAAAMKRIFHWETIEDWLKAGPRMHTLQGVARVTVKLLDAQPAAGRFHMEVTWHDSAEADEQRLALGKSLEPVCWTMVGYASGYASFCTDLEVFFIEDKCRGKGDRICSAVGRDRQSWGREIEPHVAYFHADDIQGQVLRLTRELKEKMREIARQRRRIASLERVVGASPAEVHSSVYRQVIELASRVARHDSSVLITGESGTGKEVLARYIHRTSPRADGLFLPVNCGALPETLLESELFGHKAGAFTGASRDRLGLFEEADGGTVFLDEIGDVSPSMQTKLLRVLQEHEIVRVGENRPRKVDIRVIAASNKDIKSEVKEGRFREDLYYRLGVIEIEAPPLRDRKEDIVSLARHLVAKTATRLGMAQLRLDSTALDCLNSHDWPGNVRELENVLERAAVLCRDGVIRPEDLPPGIAQATASPLRPQAGGDQSLRAVERQHIQAVLESVGGNRTRAARILGISSATLWRRLRAR
jgi:DNA-binding NtrC family response regulator/predicted hydrocarbon binding protein